MLSAILASKKVTMQTSVLTNQKTSSGLGDLYVDDRDEGGIRAGTLYLVSHYFQEPDRGPIRLRK